jgi:hypothetical protein
MVSYQLWVSIVFETLQDQGVTVTDLDDGASIMRFAGATWQRNKHRLDQMTDAEAKDAALRLASKFS